MVLHLDFEIVHPLPAAQCHSLSFTSSNAALTLLNYYLITIELQPIDNRMKSTGRLFHACQQF